MTSLITPHHVQGTHTKELLPIENSGSVGSYGWMDRWGWIEKGAGKWDMAVCELGEPDQAWRWDMFMHLHGCVWVVFACPSSSLVCTIGEAYYRKQILIFLPS